MKTFTIGDLEIDVRRHVRVDGSKFPRPGADSVADYFIVTARWQGNPIDFYPNQGRPIDPLAFGFVGKKMLTIYQNVGTEETPVMVPVGTKRGADFRRRFFRIVARRLGKAVLARQLGKTVGQVTEADIAAAATRLRNVLRGNFTNPVDLMQFDLDGACRHLRDAAGDLEEGEKPPGTVATIDCDWDARSDSDGATDATLTTVTVGFPATAVQRTGQLRFPLSSITAGATVNDSDLQGNLTSSTMEAGEGWQVQAYNDTGDDDPEADSGATRFTRSTNGSVLVSDANGTSTGSRSVDLTATADGQIQGNISSPAIYSLGLRHLGADSGTNDIVAIESIENAGSDPATLTVDYTEAGGAATYPGWYGQKGGWW